MGFWSEVAIDIQQGMPKEKAIRINAKLRYGTPEEQQEAQEESDFFYNVEQKIDSMP